MNMHSDQRSGTRVGLLLAVLLTAPLFTAVPSQAQDASEVAPPVAAEAEIPAEIAEAEVAEAEIASAEAPTELAAETGEAEVPSQKTGGEEPETEVADPAAELVGAEQPTAPSAQQGLPPMMVGLLLVCLFLVPGLIGSWLGRRLNMPHHGWKIALALGTLAAAGFAIGLGEFKLGPDLGGGVTLIYDLADPTQVTEEDRPAPAAGEGLEDSEEEEPQAEGPSQFRMEDLLTALKRRVDPTGTKEVTIRTRGKSVEVIVPRAGQAELENIKRMLTALGQLEFRIVVDRRRPMYANRIRLAESLPPGRTEVQINGRTEARWVPYNLEEFGGLGEGLDDRGAGLVKRQGVHAPEILVAMDPFNVTGKYLTSTRKQAGPQGYEVAFSFDSKGSKRFGQLTGKHIPDPNPYYLGILLDDRLLTAPSIQSRITSNGQISGRGMSEEDVDNVVSILKAGSLPAALNKIPVSEEQTSPQVGVETIEKGKQAMIASLAIVLGFILFYYRFAGFVACLTLVANIVLVLGAMLTLSAAFTLPGLAGLVLTVGMSVDANVLIFERIREELKRGATLRMAIRNGFDRATTTIVDANLTTLITGLVLYTIGTDQIKGFAITLILGIIMSMYTAIFCARILFDIGERRGWITKLSMMQLLSQSHFSFLRKWPVATAMSLLLIAAGMFGVVARQSNLLNIDFTGGTSVTMVLKEDHKMLIGEVRQALLETELADQNLLVVARDQANNANTTYTIDCSVLDDDPLVQVDQGESAVEAVERVLATTFGSKLRTYQVTLQDLRAFTEQGNGKTDTYTGVEAKLRFGEKSGGVSVEEESVYGVTHDTLVDELTQVLKQLGFDGIRPTVTNPNYKDGSSQRFRDWTIRLTGLAESEGREVINTLVEKINAEPIFPLANKIGGRVAGDMQLQAVYAILVSLLGIVGYIWIRFQKLSYGLAAVIALLHDVLVTLGLIALSAFLVEGLPEVASALQIDAFQISLPIVAAFLTIIGYSLNDTIVVFDRIREVRGKSTTLTAEMIDQSVNQTLSRTLLTSLTTLMVVVILYLFGGDGIHAFAFSLVVGVVAGTYSTIFIASPALLWLSRMENSASS